MIIAVLSDTHVPDHARGLPAAVVERVKTVDVILHAGDFTSAAVLNYLSSLAPTEAVYGNVDDSFLKATLPRSRVVSVGRFRIGLIHGDGPGPGSSTVERARRAFDNVDCVVFGHSHSPHLQWHGAVLMLNPGSPTDKRRAPRASFGLLKVDDSLEAEIVYL